MPILLKRIKHELSKDKEKVGVKSDGELKHKPPSIVSRELRDYSKLKILKLDRAVHIEKNLRAIDFTGIVPSESVSGRKYRITIRFHDIVMSSKQTDVVKVPVKIEAGVNTGKVIFYKVPTISANAVKLRCTCDDFRHRFEHELDKEDGLIGEPRKYKRETPPWEKGGRPYANSTGKVGMCKHVYSMILYLKSKGLLVER